MKYKINSKLSLSYFNYFSLDFSVDSQISVTFSGDGITLCGDHIFDSKYLIEINKVAKLMSENTIFSVNKAYVEVEDVAVSYNNATPFKKLNDSLSIYQCPQVEKLLIKESKFTFLAKISDKEQLIKMLDNFHKVFVKADLIGKQQEKLVNIDVNNLSALKINYLLAFFQSPYPVENVKIEKILYSFLKDVDIESIDLDHCYGDICCYYKNGSIKISDQLGDLKNRQLFLLQNYDKKSHEKILFKINLKNEIINLTDFSEKLREIPDGCFSIFWKIPDSKYLYYPNTDKYRFRLFFEKTQPFKDICFSFKESSDKIYSW